MILGPLPAGHQPVEVVSAVVVARPWPMAMVSRHESSLGTADPSAIEPARSSGQYQPLDSEWAHAPHGVL